jgi:hypothetical protein
MYTNSFIKEQMAQSQSCNREDIGLNLLVASDGIKKANCSDFNDLQAALNELSELLLKKDDVSQSGSADSSSENASTVNAAVPGPQNAAVPVPEFKNEKSEQKVKSSGTNVHWNYARLMNEINRVLDSDKSSDDMKTKYRNLKPQFENATKFEEVKNLVNDNNVTFYANSIYSGGTRKRRMRRVKTQRRRKNARTIKKKKITNNKSGKRN